MSEPIWVEGLTRTFGAIEAVRGIDLVVQPGEIYGFLGPNGAGKSTTVRMLTTLLRVSAGTARVAGYDVMKDPDKVRANIGVALQDAAIDPIMTGRELLKMQGALYGIPKKIARPRAEELLDRVGLQDAADRRVGGYSGGMRRRLDLAMALLHEPEVLFLDEPTTGLDPTSRMRLWEEVHRLNTEVGTTVFLTTQYLEEADELAHRIGIIDDGRIVREGIPSDLKEQVGAPTLVIEVALEQMDAAVRCLERFGTRRPARKGRIAIGLDAGAAGMANVVRALDEDSIEISLMELKAPSLDDVFAEATGRRLEGDSENGASGDDATMQRTP